MFAWMAREEWAVLLDGHISRDHTFSSVCFCRCSLAAWVLFFGESVSFCAMDTLPVNAWAGLTGMLSQWRERETRSQRKRPGREEKRKGKRERRRRKDEITSHERERLASVDPNHLFSSLQLLLFACVVKVAVEASTRRTLLPYQER